MRTANSEVERKGEVVSTDVDVEGLLAKSDARSSPTSGLREALLEFRTPSSPSRREFPFPRPGLARAHEHLGKVRGTCKGSSSPRTTTP